MSISSQSLQQTLCFDDEIERWDNEGGAPLQKASKATTEAIVKLTNLQRRILQRLGLAVVVGWNGLPTEVQKTLFRTASTQGLLQDRHDLPEDIARFLHQHKDDETST